MWGTKRESMFDGGVGNGKTTGGIMRLLFLAQEFPGSRWVVARQEYKTLMATTYKTFRKMCPMSWIKRDITSQNSEMLLANGSEILWMHLDALDEAQLRGLEINGAFISQAEEIAPEMWEFIDSRIGRWWRNEWEQACPAYIWGDCNPNGHDWIYYRFCPEVVGDPHPTRAYFFGATGINRELLDQLSPGYYQALLNKPESWKRRWMYGSRDVFEGAIHPEFRKEVHVYNHRQFNPYDAANVKSCWGWFDYGLTSPTVLLISASTADNYHFITSQYYRGSTASHTITIREHAAAIDRILRDNRYPVRGIYADPSIFFESTRDRRTATTSISQEYRECGVYFLKADNNEPASISNLQQLFAIDPHIRNPVTRQMGSPRLFISDECKELVEQIQMQRHDQARNPLTGEREFTEERSAGVPDHAYDPLRYFANSSIWQTPVFREQPKVPQYRSNPVTDAPVGGYHRPGMAPRPHAQRFQWRRFDRMPITPRYAQ